MPLSTYKSLEEDTTELSSVRGVGNSLDYERARKNHLG